MDYAIDFINQVIFCSKTFSLAPTRNQWHNKGRASGARALGRRPWGRNSTLFAVILNMFLSRNLDQDLLNNAYFLGKKTVKIVSASGAPPPDHRVVISAYYYNFVEFISSAKYILFR